MIETKFRFLECLTADLRRYRSTINGRPTERNSFSLLTCMFAPRFAPVLLCRLAHGFHCIRLTALARMISLCNFVVFGIEIAPRCRIGKGLLLPHTQGTVIGAFSIGDNATIFQGVTLGAKEIDGDYTEERRPTLGNDVLVGAGAKLLGGIRVGNRVKVGANAVVLREVPDDALAIGVPAIIRRTKC